jgi:hypothetical protein
LYRYIEELESVMAALVTAALHRGLASLFYVTERILHAMQKKSDFNPDEEEMDKWSSFPGQEQSPACKAVLALMAGAVHVDSP